MKAHEGTLRHMEREALNRGEGEVELTENPGDVQYYVKKAYGKSFRYHKADPPKLKKPKTLDLTEWNKQREAFHKTDGTTHCSAGVLCPTCKANGGGKVLMKFSSESILSNAGNMPGSREVSCTECGRTGKMLL